jgi:hypothetical protein
MVFYKDYMKMVDNGELHAVFTTTPYMPLVVDNCLSEQVLGAFLEETNCIVGLSYKRACDAVGELATSTLLDFRSVSAFFQRVCLGLVSPAP